MKYLHIHNNYHDYTVHKVLKCLVEAHLLMVLLTFFNTLYTICNTSMQHIYQHIFLCAKSAIIEYKMA